MKILDQQRQGEALLIKVDQFEDKLEDYTEVLPEQGKLIVAHSETGHHHVIDKPSQAQLLVHKTNKFIGRLKVEGDCNLVHLRSNHTHNTLNLDKGNYIVRYRREYTPEGLRKVQD